MPQFARLSLAAIATTLLILPAAAQSSPGASSSPGMSSATPAPGGGPTPAMPAPSGGRPTGMSATGTETPLDKKEDEKMKKETTICKGC